MATVLVSKAIVWIIVVFMKINEIACTNIMKLLREFERCYRSKMFDLTLSLARLNKVHGELLYRR